MAKYSPYVLLGSASAWTADQTYDDDVLLRLGTGGDQVLLNRSTSLAANTALTDVLIGTPVTPALAANSLILSNVTASGDVLIAANRGGNSENYLFADSSAGALTLYAPNGGITLSPTTDIFVNDGTGIVIGHTAQVVAESVAHELEVLGTSSADSGIMIARWGTSSAGPHLILAKSRNATIGSFSSVQNNDSVGTILALADDGTNFASDMAAISFVVDDGSPSTGAVGGEILLRTSTTSGSMTTAMQIANDQGIFFPGLSTQAAGTAVSVTSNELHLDSSSLRFKNDLGPWESSSSVLTQLRPRRFTWKIDGWEGEDCGLIAEDGAFFRPLVNLGADGRVNSYRTPVLIGALVGGWQDHEARIAELEAENQRLRGEELDG